MNQKEIKELIEFLIEKDIAEFELERGDVKVRIKRGARARPYTGAALLILRCIRRRRLLAETAAAPVGSIPACAVRLRNLRTGS